MKIFNLVREQDNTGISGLGIVASGVEFDDGLCVLRWKGEYKTTVIHESIESIKKINCSHSKSTIVYLGTFEEPKQLVATEKTKLILGL